eukprot:TRINITY_DN10481_c0_g1_i1.p1 TRINITY_DN10481_c0_g1~~TRINITY_DN10481_c0_g1_i1.p1  ORF type:complete len:398 (-),score=42.77 TRINITY_DN10481_c0_g1_i1:211-1404(-)
MFNKVEDAFTDNSPEDLSLQLLEQPVDEGTNQLEEVYLQIQPQVTYEKQPLFALQDSSSQQFQQCYNFSTNIKQNYELGAFETQVSMLQKKDKEYAVNQWLYEQPCSQYYNAQKSGSRVEVGVPAVEVQQLLALRQLQQNEMCGSKKQRVRWIPALHEMFVDVVDTLGGPWQATPKNIVVVMRQRGVQSKLDINHIKSHLQKYRQSICGGSSSTSRSNGKRKISELYEDYEEEEEEEDEVGNVDTKQSEHQKTHFISIQQQPSVQIQQELHKNIVFHDQIHHAQKLQQQQQEYLQRIRQQGFQSKSEFDRFLQAGQNYRQMMVRLLQQYRNWNQEYEEVMRQVGVQNVGNQCLKLSASASATTTTCTHTPLNSNTNNFHIMQQDKGLQLFDENQIIY